MAQSEVFDHRVVVRDPKTGQVIKENHYILHIGPEGTRYERPPHSGIFYDGSGKLLKDTKADEAKAKLKAESEAKIEADRLAQLELDKKKKP